jgi:hypothetical protein
MRIFYWFLFLLILSIASYCREIIFIGINEIIDQDFSNNPYSIQPVFLKSQSIATLIKIKFGLTGAFSIVFAIFTTYGLKASFKQNFPSQLSIVIYLIIFSLSILIAIGSIPFNSFQIVYPFLRGIIDYIHNPLLFILLSSTVLASNAIQIKSIEE